MLCQVCDYVLPIYLLFPYAGLVVLYFHGLGVLFAFYIVGYTASVGVIVLCVFLSSEFAVGLGTLALLQEFHINYIITD